MNEPVTERRRQLRYRLPLCVTTEYREQGKLQIEHMSILDMSSEGARLKFTKALAVGMSMELEIVDCDSGFVNQLGAWNKIHGDLVNLKVQAEVLRCERVPGGDSHFQIAVKFKRPIHFDGY